MAKIDKTYKKLLNKILNEGFKYEDPNRKDIYRLQIPSYQFIHDFKDGFPAITTKKLYWKGIVGELLWFLRGDTNIKYLVDNGINIWNKDAYNYYKKTRNDNNITYETFVNWIKGLHKEGEVTIGGGDTFDLGRVYGAQWRDWTTTEEWEGKSNISLLDQISNLIKGLKETPMGTKHIVTAWNPAELDDMALPPCHWSFEILVEPIHWKSRINKLEELGATWESKTNINDVLKKWKIPKYQFTLKWHQRSVDSFLGLPFNIASYALLAHIIGKMTNMIPKGIIGDLSNVHIYEPHLDAVKEQLNRNTDVLDSRCELEDFTDFKMDMHNDFNQWINSREISDFNLTEHSEQSAIKAEMLPYNK